MKKILFLILTLSVIFLMACSKQQYSTEQLVNLANCLADKNVKEYGAFWCPNCGKQERMFGKEAYDVIKSRGVYVECDPRGENEQSTLCIEEKIDKYPTWKFPDGSVVVGVMEFNLLAEKAGCSL